jgi:hypothetical protein
MWCSVYVIDNALDELDYDHEDCMIDEYQISNDNSTSTFQIGESS